MVLFHIPAQQNIQEEEMQLLHAMVAQVSISLQNALLFLDVTHGRDRLAAVLNSVGEGLIMLESSGRILLANQSFQAITGLAPDELVGKYLPDLPSNILKTLGYTRQEAEFLASSFEHGQVITSPKTTMNVTDPKPERVVERTTLPVWGQGRGAVGWMIILRDITEETQIAQARELITETLVHDLRSPVSAVLSAVDILESTLSDDQKADELVDQAVRVARNSTNRVLGLIESLLDIARLTAGRMELYMTSFDMSSLIASTISELMTQANEIGVILRNEFPAGLPHVYADQGKVTRVITNLLDNALKFTPAGGQVVVSGEAYPKDMIVIRVSDTGPGIPEEFREKIFDRFTQVPGQRGRRRGSGLGLTFCRLAVETHGGRIWVEPRMGGGSVFTFTLPTTDRANNR
jgi:PAS domain S-box-containing protein